MLTIAEAAAFLRSCDNVLILTHIRPDGDTVGCAAGLCIALRQMGKTAHVLHDPGTSGIFTPYLDGLTIEGGWQYGFKTAFKAKDAMEAVRYAESIDS